MAGIVLLSLAAANRARADLIETEAVRCAILDTDTTSILMSEDELVEAEMKGKQYGITNQTS